MMKMGKLLSPLMGVLLLLCSSRVSGDNVSRIRRQKLSVESVDLEKFLLRDDDVELQKGIRGESSSDKKKSRRDLGDFSFLGFPTGKVGKGKNAWQGPTVWDQFLRDNQQFLLSMDTSPTPAPSKSKMPTNPTIAPTSIPTNLACMGLSRSEAMLSILSEVSDEMLLLQPNTPQGVAYLWMLDGDPAMVDPCTFPTLKQRYSLASFFYSTGGSFWDFDTAWLSAANECEWLGVSCDDGEVVHGLRLVENNLMGRIPPEIGELSALRELVLRDNNLQGLVPSVINNLAQLTEIDFEFNHLVGNPFNSLIGATNLRRLRLSSNQFAGRLPNNLDDLDNLRELWIGDNFFSGPIPSAIGNIELLESLLIYENGLTGAIPAEIGNLRLFHFYAHFNRLSGPIPNGFWNNRDLIDLRLDNNRFSGALSQRIGDLSQLRDLRLANNTFTGNLPALLFRLDGIVNLLLSGNNFTGQIRDSFDMWKRLDFADFAENQFTGNIPASLFNIPTIRIVYLSDNNLEGPIPENYGNARRLKDLYLNGNRLSGQIPPISMGQLPALTEFLLQENELTGIMPASICAIRPLGGILDDLWTDCLGPNPEVQCDCCSQCFPSVA